jgi:large conductance mechanosensitive channel
MTIGNDPILDNLGMAHLGSPKALLGKKGGRMLGEFKAFAMRGSMLDMAVGIIVGAAFGRVVSSFVSDILPRLACSQATRISQINSSTSRDMPMPRLPRRKLRVQPRSITASSSTLLSDFLIVAFVVFMLIRQVKPEERARGIRRSNERLPILSLCRCDQSNPLSALHVRLDGGLSQARRVSEHPSCQRICAMYRFGAEFRFCREPALRSTTPAWILRAELGREPGN